MPLPKPHSGESQSDFISRCMDDETAKKDFPDRDQRLGVCFTQWRERENKVRTWYEIKAQESGPAEILLYDEIGESFFGGGTGAKSFVEDLRKLKTRPLNLRINSPGGNVFDGFAIFNALRRHPERVEVDIDGMALSIASVIALAGQEIRMAKNALFMIHEPHGMAIGNATDMRKMADTLEKVREGIKGTYTDRTGLSDEQILSWIADETWFTAAEALEHGFVDEITPEQQITACFDLDRYRFKHIPQQAKENIAKPPHEDRRFRLAHMAQVTRNIQRKEKST